MCQTLFEALAWYPLLLSTMPYGSINMITAFTKLSTLHTNALFKQMACNHDFFVIGESSSASVVVTSFLNLFKYTFSSHDCM